MSTLVVTDTSCLIALDRIDQLGLLPALFAVLAPPAVVAEFGQRPAWLDVRPAPDPERVVALLERVDQGEAEAIVLALSVPGADVLIDEARGRRGAERLGLQVTGTAGVLLEAKRRGLVPTVRPLLDALVHEHGFHTSDGLYAAVLRSAGES